MPSGGLLPAARTPRDARPTHSLDVRISILAVGHKAPGWVQEGFTEYTRRMPPEARVELVELKPEERGAGRSVDEVRASGMGLAEGVFTAPVAHAVARSHAIDAPLIDAVTLLLSGEARIEQIVPTLMRRPLKREG